MDFSIFDSLFDSAVVIDEKRSIVYCNEAAARLAGSSVRRMTRGLVFSNVFDIEDPDLFPVAGGELGKEIPSPIREVNIKIPNQDKSGKVQITVQPFHQENQKFWIVTLRDVTLEETLHTKYQGELKQKEGYILELQNAKSQLEDYSKNLEKMVQERTQELRSANTNLNAVMNSLGQGFLVFDSEGICSEVYTKACETILEIIPSGKSIFDVLRVSSEKRNQTEMWLKGLFLESLPFEMMADLGEKEFSHSQSRHITLEYYPLRDESDSVRGVVLVATDKTEERAAQMALAKEQQNSAMILKLIKNRDQFAKFLGSVRETIDSLIAGVEQDSHLDYDYYFRVLHTIEGEAGLFSLADLRRVSRLCQELLEPFRLGSDQDLLEEIRESKIRFSSSLGDLKESLIKFINENHELLHQLKIGDEDHFEISRNKIEDFLTDLRSESKSNLYKKFLTSFYYQPIEKYLSHYNDVIQQVSGSQGKIVAPLKIISNGVKVHPFRFESLFSSLVHSFRNAIDHGIEPPEDRIIVGKPSEASIQVIVKEVFKGHDRWIHLEITDDGRGVDCEVVRLKLISKFPGHKFESEEEVLSGLFLPGFSTRDSVGAFSGRGVGMDAIKASVLALGGEVKMTTQLGRGSQLVIDVPDKLDFETLAKTA